MSCSTHGAHAARRTTRRPPVTPGRASRPAARWVSARCFTWPRSMATSRASPHQHRSRPRPKCRRLQMPEPSASPATLASVRHASARPQSWPRSAGRRPAPKAHRLTWCAKVCRATACATCPAVACWCPCATRPASWATCKASRPSGPAMAAPKSCFSKVAESRAYGTGAVIRRTRPRCWCARATRLAQACTKRPAGPWRWPSTRVTCRTSRRRFARRTRPR